MSVKELISGSIAGVVSQAMIYPLDYVRTRVQVEHKSVYQVLSSTKGLRGYYRGIWSPLVAQGVYKAVMFSSYGYMYGGDRFDYVNIFESGMFGGFVNSFVVCPVEYVRNQLIAGRLFRTIDYRRLYNGLGFTVLRDSIGVGFWFLSFNIFNNFMLKQLEFPERLSVLLSGGLGGVMFWTVALPFDTIKSRIQTNGVYNDFSNLYKGYRVAIMRGFPSAGIVFLVQSELMKIL